MLTKQMKLWRGNLGKDYTNRNLVSLEEMENRHKQEYGINRTEMNLIFLSHLDKSFNILEVGCNIGNQLLCLQKMGFDNLSGIELQDHALEIARSRLEKVRLSQGSIFDLPFESGTFDLVFTSGVLIHVSPTDIKNALAEIYRCTRTLIWGFEYYAKTSTEIIWHGKPQLLWRNDYARLYQIQFSDLKLEQERIFKYLCSGEHRSSTSMYLLRKRS